jgi:hypothetical protein
VQGFGDSIASMGASLAGRGQVLFSVGGDELGDHLPALPAGPFVHSAATGRPPDPQRASSTQATMTSRPTLDMEKRRGQFTGAPVDRDPAWVSRQLSAMCPELTFHSDGTQTAAAIGPAPRFVTAKLGIQMFYQPDPFATWEVAVNPDDEDGGEAAPAGPEPVDTGLIDARGRGSALGLSERGDGGTAAAMQRAIATVKSAAVQEIWSPAGKARRKK